MISKDIQSQFNLSNEDCKRLKELGIYISYYGDNIKLYNISYHNKSTICGGIYVMAIINGIIIGIEGGADHA